VIVELCETVQILSIELANFELFSSSARDVRVSVTERYPTHEWLHFMDIHMADSRQVQVFAMAHRHYAKYVRVSDSNCLECYVFLEYSKTGNADFELLISARIAFASRR
jgi:hypothetical protein